VYSFSLVWIFFP